MRAWPIIAARTWEVVAVVDVRAELAFRRAEVCAGGGPRELVRVRERVLAHVVFEPARG